MKWSRLFWATVLVILMTVGLAGSGGLSADQALGSPQLAAGSQPSYVPHEAEPGSHSTYSVSDQVQAPAQDYWSLFGNAGTYPGSNFLGTTDGVSLTLAVSNTAALRLEPTDGTPNLLGGYDGNWTGAGVHGATISGGGRSGGYPNRVNSHYGTIGGGAANLAGDVGGDISEAGVATVGGGWSNSAVAGIATVGGGANNWAASVGATISGGYSNTISISGTQGTISGGDWNIVEGDRGVIGGGNANSIAMTGTMGTISGGGENALQGVNGVIGGGWANTVLHTDSTVGGGNQNWADGWAVTIAGGYANSTGADGASVGGGEGNQASGSYAAVAGGLSNYAGGYGAVGGGESNDASGWWGTVGGGRTNTAIGQAATVCGGEGNYAYGDQAAIGGGQENRAWAGQATIGGGYNNEVDEYATTGTVGGGEYNFVSGSGATIGGGKESSAFGSYATVGGGEGNHAAGYAATIPGGYGNHAAGNYSFAGGRMASAGHDGSFVWADSTEARFASQGTNQFLIRAEGGVGIGTNDPQRPLHITDGTPYLRFEDTGGGSNWEVGAWGENGYFRIVEVASADQHYTRLAVEEGGHVGIGTSYPQRDLHIRSGQPYVRFEDTQGGNKWEAGVFGESYDFRISEIVGSAALPRLIVEEGGRVKVQELEILGGSDLAEPFDVAGPVEPGMVVAIDPENPGQLRLAEGAYDRTVAGCVSGANGLNPGLVMAQEGSAADGAFPVALSGRVYCWADASYGAIQPGDLLTTSDTAGHAMVAGDYERAQGAIIGKAMSRLEEGQGLVLVLVTLQ
jgi:hypothetical protein